jgi:dipeptidyl aminopeptidase/acylaminoacyl peptidase
MPTLPLALALVASVQSAPEKRAFEVRDVWGAPRVGAPALSPDGGLAAYVLAHHDLEAGESWSELWLVATDGSSAPRRLTHAPGKKGTVSSPFFSPDGERLLFLSTRGDGQQIHALPLAGGEATQLTDWPCGFSDPVISPDGRFIAAAVEVYPECGADGGCNQAREEQRSGGKTKVHVADELLYRHWTSWRDGRVAHVILFDAETGAALRDLTPGPFDSPTFSLGGDRGFAFSPDSRELAFVSNRDADQAQSTNADLWVVPLEGGEPRNLTAANRGWDGAPLYSPDGTRIAFVSQETPSYESDLRRLSVLELSTGAVRRVTHRGNFDDMVVDMAWSADGRALVFEAERRGRTPLYRVDLSTGAIEELVSHGTLDGFELAPDGTAVYAARRVHEPTELYRCAPGGVPERLTEHTAALAAAVDLRPAEELWVEAGEGYSVHAFVVKPHGFDPTRRYPLILNVHGGPQSQWSDAFRGDWQVYPGKGYVVAFANPTGSTGYGQEFTDAIACDWGGRVYRDLIKVVDALEALPYVDPQRVGVMGWSFGGYMTMWMQGQTDRFAAIASMMGLYDLESFYGATEELWFPEKDLCGPPWSSEDYERWSPSNHVERFETPALVITGELDYRVPYTQSLDYFTALQKMGVPSRLIVFPGAGHWPAWHEMAFYYNAHLEFFHQWLGGEPAPWDVEEYAARGKPPAPDAAAGAASAAAGARAR